jgi:WD40 repeat protein
MRKALCGVALALWIAPAAPASAATRVLYTSDWSGHTEIYAVDPAGRAGIAKLTGWQGACPAPPYYSPVALNPSPNGRYLAVNCGAGLWLMRTNGRDAQELVPAGELRQRPIFSRWSRDSKLLGYRLDESVYVVNPVTSLARLAGPRDLAKMNWNEQRAISPNGRWVAEVSGNESFVVRLKDGVRRRLPGAIDARWSPDGNRLALESPDAIRVVNMRSGRVRLLTNDVGFGNLGQYEVPNPLGLSWSPDGGSIAYVVGKEAYGGASWSIATGDLRIVTMRGRVRTLVSADAGYGTQMRAVAWVKATTVTRKQEDQAGLLAGGAIDLLAADGKRVAFEACDTIVVWTPSLNTADPATQPNSCGLHDTSGRYYLYGLALAGDRLLYGLNEGCMSIRITLNLRVVAPPGGESEIARSFGNCGAPFGQAYGRAAGSGGLLVFGEWSESYAPAFPFPVTSATVRRVDGTNCPCPALASTLAPLYPADVDDGRVVVYGDNETIVLDRNGNRLMSVPVSSQAAQLSGNDLVLLTPGQLRDYDVRNGDLLHTWKVPDVSSGPVCGWRICEPRHLVLSDAARGLVVYIVDGQLHLLRLADGADAIVHHASLARFMDDGLVYADGARLRLHPYTQLPLRGF